MSFALHAHFLRNLILLSLAARQMMMKDAIRCDFDIVPVICSTVCFANPVKDSKASGVFGANSSTLPN
jgi:hypothetical protein